METKFKISLENSTTKQLFEKEESFLTFEEACIFANKLRNSKGHDWTTTSITRAVKGQKNVTEA